MVSTHIRQMKWPIYHPGYEHPVVKNGDFTILHLELILADELTDLPPQ